MTSSLAPLFGIVLMVVYLCLPEDIKFLLGAIVLLGGLTAAMAYMIAIFVDDAHKDGKERGWW